MPLFPIRHDQREPVQYQLSKAVVVLAQIVDLRLVQSWGRASVQGRAIQIGRATCLKREIELRVTRIKTGQWFVSRTSTRIDVHQPESVSREIAGPLYFYLHTVVGARIGSRALLNPFHLDVADPNTTVNSYIVLTNVRGGFADKINAEPRLFLIDLQIVNSVQVALA